MSSIGPDLPSGTLSQRASPSLKSLQALCVFPVCPRYLSGDACVFGYELFVTRS